MNKDERPPAALGSRLKRIKVASRIFQFFIGFSVLFCIYWLMAFLFHWPFFNEGKIRIVLYGSHIYNSPADVPSDIVAMLFVKAGWGIVIAVDLFALFQLYARGILFSARNVQFIRFFGYWLVVNWFIDQHIQFALHDMVSTTPLCAGFIIIFVAWIMDEGRKIQEEQELTV